MTTRAALLAGVAFTMAMATGAAAQTTPGDQSGTARSAGEGQSAATTTNAPASPTGTPAPTLAPPPPRTPDSAATMGEVIVTARRVEERLQDVPISITVFNQQQLNNRNVVQATDLATYTPSLSVDTNFGAENSTFAIRGFVQEIGTQPAVGVYFADVVEPRAASNNIPAGDGAGPGDFFDLQNVQVLKGPQGTLFGRNTTGGAVLLVPQKPTGRTEGYLEISAGDYDMNRIQGVFNTPITDKLRLRVGVDHEARDGYAENDSGIGPSAFDDIDYTALRGSLVWDVTPNLENYTIASYTRSNTNGNVLKVTGALPASSLSAFGAQLSDLLGESAAAQIAAAQAKGAGFDTVQNAPLTNPHTVLDITRVINTTTWRASDSLTLKNIASYAELQEDLLSPIFGTDLDLHNSTAGAFAYPAGTLVSFALSAPYTNGHTAHESTLSEEFQAQGNLFDNRLIYQGGVYYEASVPLDNYDGSQSPILVDCSSIRNFVCDNPTGNGAENLTLGRTSYHNLGVYTQGTYTITDKLKVTGGFRYTWDHERSFNILKTYVFPTGLAQSSPTGFACTLDPTNAALLAAGCAQVITQRSSAPTGTVDLDYKPIDDLLLYVKYSRGYRAGGVVPEAPAPFQTYQPESVNSYELGEKYTIRAPIRGTVDVTGFYNDLSNQQLQSSLNPKPGTPETPASGIINAGSSRIYGVELESSLNLFQGFTLDIGYTYLNSELTSVPTIVTPASSPYDVSFPAKVGDPTPLAPENKYTITGTYVLPLDPDYGRIALSATFTHIDRELSNYPDLQGTLAIPGISAAGLSFPGQTITIPGSIAALGYNGAEDLLNLNVNWNSVMRSNFDIQAFATNITNDQYYTSSSGLFPSTEFETSQLGEPRMYGFRVRYHFGG